MSERMDRREKALGALCSAIANLQLAACPGQSFEGQCAEATVNAFVAIVHMG